MANASEQARDAKVSGTDFRYRKFQLVPGLFQDNELSVGGFVKKNQVVLSERRRRCSRPPNLTCRIETFGRILQRFDCRRRGWVKEMGFSGLLSIPVDLQLPRQIGYWLMSRIDPISRKLIGCDGKDFFFSKNQVQWVLGIPNGGLPVPSYKTMNLDERERVEAILRKYGKSMQSKSSRYCDRVYYSKSIAVDSKVMDLLEGVWGEDQEEEFKTLFLIVSLHMVLCPTQSPRLSVDLIPALACGMNCSSYDWCGLVIDCLMESISSFACRFYGSGFAVGCGGCSIFVVLFYLDRLNRNPVDWGVFPRIKVWSMKLIRSACRADQMTPNGDYGKLGMLDVAYGEQHPRCARDMEAPVSNEQDAYVSSSRLRKRRRATTEKTPFMRKLDKANSVGQADDSIIYSGSFLCHRFNALIVRLHDAHPIIDRCEITVFFPNCLKKVVFITSAANYISFKPSAIFISLSRYEAIVLKSGFHSITLAELMQEIGQVPSLVRLLQFYSSRCNAGAYWRIRQISNIPLRRK